MTHKPNIQRLFENRDLAGLVSALRYPQDASIRVQAARFLGETGNLKAVESLLRAYSLDPEETVRSAASTALHQVLGREADTAISAYVPPDESWIEETPTMEVEHEDRGVDWDESHIQGLVAIIRLDHDRQKRIKAIQALSKIENTRAIDALASLAIWSDETWLKRAARLALQDVYGDDLDEILQSYRQDWEEDDFSTDEKEEEEDEFEEEDDDDEDDWEEEDSEGEDESSEELTIRDGSMKPDFEGAFSKTDAPKPAEFSQQVIQEEKPGVLAYALLGLLFLLIVGALIYYLIH